MRNNFIVWSSVVGETRLPRTSEKEFNDGCGETPCVVLRPEFGVSILSGGVY
jgi:hypothetical protein